MAGWCVVTGQSPSVYMDLTILEREAFLDAVDRMNRST